jgi:hypothetical protein
VLKCPDDRKNRVVSAQATYPCGSSAVGGRVCEQRYALPDLTPAVWVAAFIGSSDLGISVNRFCDPKHSFLFDNRGVIRLARAESQGKVADKSSSMIVFSGS